MNFYRDFAGNIKKNYVNNINGNFLLYFLSPHLLHWDEDYTFYYNTWYISFATVTSDVAATWTTDE